jgi:2TM domain
MTSDPGNESRAAALAYLERRRKFAADAFGYLAVNGVLWLIWALTGHADGGRLPWPAWVSLIWGFFLALDALRVFGPWARRLDAPIGEDEIERELDRRARHV